MYNQESSGQGKQKGTNEPYELVKTKILTYTCAKERKTLSKKVTITYAVNYDKKRR